MPADGALQSHPTAAPKAAPGGPSPSSPASEDQELRRALPEAGSQEPPDIPQEGAGLTASACGGGPGKEDRAQDLPLPESQGDHAEPRKDPQAAGQPAEATPSGVSREQSDDYGAPAGPTMPRCLGRHCGRDCPSTLSSRSPSLGW